MSVFIHSRLQRTDVADYLALGSRRLRRGDVANLSPVDCKRSYLRDKDNCIERLTGDLPEDFRTVAQRDLVRYLNRFEKSVTCLDASY